MAEQSVAFLSSLRKDGDTGTDFFREAVRQFVHDLMDEEVTAFVGTKRYERSEERATQRSLMLDEMIGQLQLARN